MSFAARLKALRMRSGQSLQELADAVKLSKPHVWELETGKSKNPTKDVLEKLADHFKVAIAYLVGEGDENEDTQLGMMFRQIRELSQHDIEVIQAIIDTQRRQKAP